MTRPTLRPGIGFSLFLTLVLAEAPVSLAQQATDSLDFARIGAALSEHLQVEPGEKVLLVGSPGRFDPLVPLLRQHFEAVGADFLGTWSVTGPAPERWSTAFTDRISAAPQADLPRLLADVDASIMMPGANTTHAVYGAIQEVLRQGSGRTIHFHWIGAYDVEGSLLADSAAIDSLYQRALLETDYHALAQKQRLFESAMRSGRVRVMTPAGTDISFEIGSRPVNRQDGDASRARASRAAILIDREIELPAGAVRVAPIEESVNGTIAFPPSIWSGESVTGLTLRFEHGIASEVTATSGLQAVAAELEAAGGAGRAFREFALGFNPLLAVDTDNADLWIPYYGYGAGVVRLSLGDNTELGGNVGGGYVRWNFFVDATVTVGDTVWVRDGRLIR